MGNIEQKTVQNFLMQKTGNNIICIIFLETQAHRVGRTRKYIGVALQYICEPMLNSNTCTAAIM